MSIKIKWPSAHETGFAFETLSSRKKISLVFLFLIFIISGIFLFWRVNDYFMISVAAEGGSLSEGIIGSPRFINPLLAISDADRDLTTLIYSGLLRFGPKGNLIPDLAKDYQISSDGLTYTFTLKKNLYWSDGEKITVDDIIYTIDLAQNPAVKSIKRANWSGVETQKIDDQTVQFVLEKRYPAFLENATLGILPKHLWSKNALETFALNELNIQAIGSGPYQIKSIVRDANNIPTEYHLTANPYFILGQTKITDLHLYFYPNEKDLLSSYQTGKIQSLSAVSTESAQTINQQGGRVEKIPLSRIFAVFFNQNKANIFTNKEVRQALDLATPRAKIVKDVLNNYGLAIYNVFPDNLIDLENEKGNAETASALLKKNGWSLNSDGVMAKTVVDKKKKTKSTQTLTFSLTTSNVPELKELAQILKTDWAKIGAKVEVQIYEPGDLNQDIIKPRKYDALLFGQVLSRDFDPFPFWHSSQRLDPGLNLALYTNATVDKLLESERGTDDKNDRLKIYQKIAVELNKDKPAVFIYSPYFLYVLPAEIKGLSLTGITNSSDRFSNVYKWYVKTDKVWKIFANPFNLITN